MKSVNNGNINWVYYIIQRVNVKRNCFILITTVHACYGECASFITNIKFYI